MNVIPKTRWHKIIINDWLAVKIKRQAYQRGLSSKLRMH